MACKFYDVPALFFQSIQPVHSDCPTVGNTTWSRNKLPSADGMLYSRRAARWQHHVVQIFKPCNNLHYWNRIFFYPLANHNFDVAAEDRWQSFQLESEVVLPRLPYLTDTTTTSAPVRIIPVQIIKIIFFFCIDVVNEVSVWNAAGLRVPFYLLKTSLNSWISW